MTKGHEEITYPQQALLVSTFLGGVLFAALILVLSAKKTFDVPALGFTPHVYFDFLIVGLGATIVFSVIGSWLIAAIAGKDPSVNPFLESLANFSFSMTIVGTLASVVMLLAPFSPRGAVLIFVLISVLVIIIGLAIREVGARLVRFFRTMIGQFAQNQRTKSAAMAIMNNTGVRSWPVS